MKRILLFVFTLFIGNILLAQSHADLENRIQKLEKKLERVDRQSKNFYAKFGKGIQIVANDSSFYMKAAFRIQSLYANDWSVRNDQIGFIENHKPNFLIRRARLKFNGWAFTQKLKYKLELGLSNRDISGGDSKEYKNGSRIILDAYVEWNFWNNFSILAGQTKLPGNRERIVSSANMQFVDRSLLNSKFNIDRDMGIQLKHHFKFGKQFIVQETFAFSQGEGRNITAGSFDGLNYTFKVEAFPFGKFASKGAYVGSDIKREQKPKLAIAVAYDFNQNSVKERSQLGSFITDDNGNYVGKNLHHIFADLMFKYKGFSIMSEYAFRTTKDGNPNVFAPDDPTSIIGTFYTGQAFNFQAAYLFKKNYELAGRFTMVLPQNTDVDNKQFEYTIGASKYFLGHKLKIQTDLGYRSITDANDKLFWRVQTDIHF